MGDDEFNAQFKDEIAALARAVTVYVSSDDKALLLSEWIHGGKRLGRTRAEKQQQFEEMIDLLELEAKGAEEITVIDVSPDLVKAWTVARHGQLCFQVVSAFSGQNWTVEVSTG